MFMTVFAVAVLGCPKGGVFITPQPPKVNDQASCVAACANLKYLGCSQANPIDMETKCKSDADCKDLNGNTDAKQQCSALGSCIVTCTNFCSDTEDQGVWLDPTCVAKVTSCDQIESCPTPAPKQATR